MNIFNKILINLSIRPYKVVRTRYAAIGKALP